MNRNNKILSGFALLIIVAFSFYLRYEDFSVWQKSKEKFQYQGEYQMANFDSYYYLRAAKDIQNGQYNDLDELRRVPNNMARYSPAPLLSRITSGISSMTGIPISTIAIFIPIILSSMLAVVVFLLGMRFGYHPIAALFAAFFSIISLTYVIRTRIGVFDTDSMNVVFMMLNTYLLISFAEIKTKKRYLFLAMAALSTFLYYMWWNTASSVVVVSTLVPLIVAILFYYRTSKPSLKYSILGAITLLSLFFVREQMFSYFDLLFQNKASLFPKNMNIEELNSISLDDFIKRSIDNKLIFLLYIAGLLTFIWKHKTKALFLTIPILLAFSPFLAGNRFIIFAAPIMGLAIAQLIQLLFNYKSKVKPVFTYLIAAAIAGIGISSNYSTITKGYAKPAAYENTALLNILKEKTPKNAKIWTDSDLGYQIQYYLDRGTYADGEFTDGELYYYLYYPLASNNLALSANFIQLYNAHGIQGMQDLYKIFPDINSTFVFLKKVLSKNPNKAEVYLNKLNKDNKLPKSDKLKTVDQWISYLYPTPDETIYLLLHNKMTQTAAWFKQGNSDLKTGKTKGLPLFLIFNGLKEEGGKIANNQINVNTKNGTAKFGNGSQSFQEILTYDGSSSKVKKYKQIKDGGFILHWNKSTGFGAAMSKEMSRTTLAKLFIQNKSSVYFEPVELKSPTYQIWKVKGGRYEK